MTIKGRPVSTTSITLKGAAAIGANVTAGIKNAGKHKLTKLKSSKETAAKKKGAPAKEKSPRSAKSPSTKAATKSTEAKVSEFKGSKVTDGRAVGGVSTFSKQEPMAEKKPPKATQMTLPGMRNTQQFKEPRGK